MRKGSHLSEEARKKRIGRIPWNKGKTDVFSDESRALMSESHGKYYETHSSPMKGKHHSEEARRRIGEARKGRKHSVATKQKIGAAHKNKHLSEEHKMLLSELRKGKYSGVNSPMHGKHHSDETRKKIGEGNRGKVVSEETKVKMSNSRKGDKNYFWCGGKSFELYTIDWNKTLKRSIRERDKYICRLCCEQQTDAAFPVHHIDYDKKNCNPNNLITLCKKCHTKTNFNRVHWKRYLEDVIKKVTE